VVPVNPDAAPIEAPKEIIPEPPQQPVDTSFSGVSRVACPAAFRVVSLVVSLVVTWERRRRRRPRRRRQRRFVLVATFSRRRRSRT